MQHLPASQPTLPLRTESMRGARAATVVASFSRATSVRLIGRRGAIAIARRAGEVVVQLEGDRVEELLPRAAAELSLDLGRLEHLIVDASQVREGADTLARWADTHRDRAARVTFVGPAEARGLIATRPSPRALEQARLA